MIRAEGERGVILIALLWILTALAVIALSFAREASVEVSAARNTRDLSDSYYIARAGMAAAVYRLYQKRFVPRVRQLELPGPPDPIDLGKFSGTFGDGAYDVDIQDESGKINLNFVQEEQIRNLCQVVGIAEPDAGIITDSLMDWKDVDNAHRINGAEDDYYQSLDPPYLAKNGRMDTVEELLLVRGVTPDYYYGHRERGPDGNIIYRYGLSRYFTVYSTSPLINVNFAPPQVLMSIPDMPPDAAQAIYAHRLEQPFENPQEISKVLGMDLGPQVAQALTTQQTNIFTLTAAAHRENSKVRRVVRAVISLDPREPKKYKVLYWNENVPNL